MNQIVTIVPDETPDREAGSRKKRGGLFVTDAELIERLNVPEKIARQAIEALDKNSASGFPRKSQLWGGRRYWPAVRAYLDRTNGPNIGTSAPLPRRERHG